MKGKILTEGQIRGRLAHIGSDFKGHGKELDRKRLREFVVKRLEQGPPYLGEYFKDYEERDYKILLNIIDFDASTEKEIEQVEKTPPAESTPKKTKKKKKVLGRPEVSDDDDIDLDDV